MNKSQIRRTVLTAVFTGLISVGAYAVIPIGPVPIILTNLFILLSGLLGGFRVGLFSNLAYLLLGILGFPVFAGGAAGLAVLWGPTGGYLVGYPLAAAIAGAIYRPREGMGRQEQIFLASLAGLAAGAVIYLTGVPWLKLSFEMDWPTALKAGMLPFIPGDLLKTAAAVALTILLKDRFSEFLEAE